MTTSSSTDATARPLQPLPVEKYPVERRGIVLRPHGIVEQSEKSRAAASNVGFVGRPAVGVAFVPDSLFERVGANQPTDVPADD